MGYWIELMCDLARSGIDPKQPTLHGCHTARGDSPGQRVWTQGGANVAMTSLRRDALNNGWKMTKKGLACPFCSKHQ